MVAVAGLGVFRYIADTFVRPEKVYVKALSLIEADPECRLKLGPLIPFPLADRMQLYSVSRSTGLAGFFSPTTFEVG